jgi:hypothetical protein
VIRIIKTWSFFLLLNFFFFLNFILTRLALILAANLTFTSLIKFAYRTFIATCDEFIFTWLTADATFIFILNVSKIIFKFFIFNICMVFIFKILFIIVLKYVILFDLLKILLITRLVHLNFRLNLWINVNLLNFFEVLSILSNYGRPASVFHKLSLISDLILSSVWFIYCAFWYYTVVFWRQNINKIFS